MAGIAGIIGYRGPSLIDGKPIILVYTLNTRNEKTGPMIQSWVMREDIHPVEAIQTGEDTSVCGNCAKRGEALGTAYTNRPCYVTPNQAPSKVWHKATGDDPYPMATPKLMERWIEGDIGRTTSYGDPTAVPIEVWKPTWKMLRAHTGYTAMHDQPQNQDFRYYLMASTHSVRATYEAWDRGWRTYRIRREGDPLLKGEMECPASKAGGFRELCYTCRACDGYKRPGQVSVSCEAHGSRPVKSAMINLINKQEAKDALLPVLSPPAPGCDSCSSCSGCK